MLFYFILYNYVQVLSLCMIAVEEIKTNQLGKSPGSLDNPAHSSPLPSFSPPLRYAASVFETLGAGGGSFFFFNFEKEVGFMKLMWH